MQKVFFVFVGLIIKLCSYRFRFVFTRGILSLRDKHFAFIIAYLIVDSEIFLVTRSDKHAVISVPICPGCRSAAVIRSCGWHRGRHCQCAADGWCIWH
jgi:hypothetical protein